MAITAPHSKDRRQSLPHWSASESGQSAALVVALLCLVLLTAFAGVLFVQHEADRNAARHALAPATSSGPQVVCPGTGRIVEVMSEC